MFYRGNMYKHNLKNVTISESGPGTILKDFNVLLDYLGRQELQVAGPHQMPRNVLAEVNALLAHPVELRLARPQQKSYPHINGLYLLMRASGLVWIEARGKNLFLAVDQEIYRAWKNLSPTEQYFTLLETWLLRGKDEIIGERGGGPLSLPDHYRRWIDLYGQIPEEGLQVAGDKDIEYQLRYTPGWYNLGLLDLFGLITVQSGSPKEGEGWQIERIHRTIFGKGLLALLYSEFFRDICRLVALGEKGKIPAGVLQPVLKPYFPGWINTLAIPEWIFREGTHIFKVSLGATRVRIAIPANHTLEWLATAILKAFRFDDDHLYLFSYQNRFGALEEVHHPSMDEGPWTDDLRVGAVPLRVGQAMTFLFDFGDNWEFEVILESVDPERAVKKPVILEKHGKPPKQYPRWDY